MQRSFKVFWLVENIDCSQLEWLKCAKNNNKMAILFMGLVLYYGGLFVVLRGRGFESHFCHHLSRNRWTEIIER